MGYGLICSVLVSNGFRNIIYPNISLDKRDSCCRAYFIRKHACDVYMYVWMFRGDKWRVKLDDPNHNAFAMVCLGYKLANIMRKRARITCCFMDNSHFQRKRCSSEWSIECCEMKNTHYQSPVRPIPYADRVWPAADRSYPLGTSAHSTRPYGHSNGSHNYQQTIHS